ncbi:MAG: OmpA family protein, partial [Candidatus Zixiibacteriota bacterium]
LNGVLRGNEIAIKRNGLTKKTGHGLLKLGNLKMIQQKIEERFKTIGKNEEIETEITERGLVIHIMESALFRVGSATLEQKALNVLDLVAAQITPLPNHIRIEGHTDDRPISTPLYPSNWELSSARATEVVRYFIDGYGLTPDRISALGYGEYRPVRPNNSVENRAANRRVDVVILTMELTLKEPTSQLYWSEQAQ